MFLYFKVAGNDTCYGQLDPRYSFRRHIRWFRDCDGTPVLLYIPRLLRIPIISDENSTTGYRRLPQESAE